jgi:hypothetical protein
MPESRRSLHLPDLPRAEAILLEAESRNPGPWVSHSRWVADAARRIATALPGLDGEALYILGLLHDVGRRFGVTGMRHVYDGWRYLTGLGYPDAGRASLTHSFPRPDLRQYFGERDLTPAETSDLESALAAIRYDDYDRLIQLCDTICLPNGFVLMEKRMVDVMLRYGCNEFTRAKLQAFFDIRSEIENRLGRSVYSLLPGVIENTFG